MVQQKHMAEKIKASFHHVDMVFGVHALYRLPEILYRAITEGRRIFEVTESEGAIAESLPVLRKSVMKSWVPVMYGAIISAHTALCRTSAVVNEAGSRARLIRNRRPCQKRLP